MRIHYIRTLQVPLVSMSMTRLLQFVSLFGCLAIATAAVAQTTNTATLLVIVADQTGAAVPGATVSITNAATGASRDCPPAPMARPMSPACR